MNEQRFSCTACGRCCYGWLPLTLDEALAQADVFPLAVTLTPIKPTERSFKLASQLGLVLQLPAKQKIAVLISPTAYIPPTIACPLLSPENLCLNHESKPLRCRAMPFYPFLDEGNQSNMLIPRKGWLCDTGTTAPVVYKDKKILDKTAFETERKALLAQAPVLRSYADKLLRHNPMVMAKVLKSAQSRVSNRIAINFTSFLRLERRNELQAFAERQHAVMASWADKTANDQTLAEYHDYYKGVLSELSCFVEKPTTRPS